jgi:site-specific DNA recombinase
MARADPARAGLTVRCAIYTRKSSDEGLEQEFNSLDAQREACEAYIVSQRHAGWIALSDMYDDGGLSGGTMERLHSSGFWRISRPGRFKSSLSTRSTG